jgi:predicted nuclease of predicted toxin-antitoxin system
MIVDQIGTGHSIEEILADYPYLDARNIMQVSSGPNPCSQIPNMAFAAEHSYIVLTHDLDFGTILAAAHDEKRSVVQIRSEIVNEKKNG